jgi:hypothetical protein
MVSTEDSFSMISGSTGHRLRASEHLKSEIAIVTGIAKALLPDNPNVKWEEWTADYSLVRDLIEQTYPDDFGDFNKRMFEPGGVLLSGVQCAGAGESPRPAVKNAGVEVCSGSGRATTRGTGNLTIRELHKRYQGSRK